MFRWGSLVLLLVSVGCGTPDPDRREGTLTLDELPWCAGDNWPPACGPGEYGVSAQDCQTGEVRIVGCTTAEGEGAAIGCAVHLETRRAYLFFGTNRPMGSCWQEGCMDIWIEGHQCEFLMPGPPACDGDDVCTGQDQVWTECVEGVCR